MTGYVYVENENTCTHDFKAPALRVLRQPSFVQELAKFYEDLGLSGPATVYWIQEQLFDRHDGKLYDYDSKLLNIDNDPSLTDNVWKEDERRTVLRIRDRANKPFKYLLQKRMIPAVTLMHFAREIYICRTQGKCSCAK